MTRRQFGETPLILDTARFPAASDMDDPAVIAYRRWKAAREAELDFYRRSPDLAGDDCPEFLALEQAAMEAERALANTVATTPAGLAGQVLLAFRIFGELRPGPDHLGIAPDDYEVPDGMEGGGGAELLRNMLASAERMAGEPPDR